MKVIKKLRSCLAGLKPNFVDELFDAHQKTIWARSARPSSIPGSWPDYLIDLARAAYVGAASAGRLDELKSDLQQWAKLSPFYKKLEEPNP